MRPENGAAISVYSNKRIFGRSISEEPAFQGSASAPFPAILAGNGFAALTIRRKPCSPHRAFMLYSSYGRQYVRDNFPHYDIR